MNPIVFILVFFTLFCDRTIINRVFLIDKDNNKTEVLYKKFKHMLYKNHAIRLFQRN